MERAHLRLVADTQAARPYIAVKDVSQIFRRGGTVTHALDHIDLTAVSYTHLTLPTILRV